MTEPSSPVRALNDDIPLKTSKIGSLKKSKAPLPPRSSSDQSDILQEDINRDSKKKDEIPYLRNKFGKIGSLSKSTKAPSRGAEVRKSLTLFHEPETKAENCNYFEGNDRHRLVVPFPSIEKKPFKTN